MKLLQNLKKDKKGFTLVEMIVVIVIIGILLAILVPGMFKYIDKAKDKQILVNARTAQLNLETAVRELYGKNQVTIPKIADKLNDHSHFVYDSTHYKIEIDNPKVEVTILAIPDGGKISNVVMDDVSGKIKEFRYTQNDNKYVEYDENGWGDVINIK